MADSNLLKRGEPRHLDDNDPFAELTRIMGRDSQAAGEDDFGIDLEKELLGDLDASFADESSEMEVGAEDVASPTQDYSTNVHPAPMEAQIEAGAAADEELTAETFDDPLATDFDAPEWQDEKVDPAQTGIARYDAPAAQWQPEPMVETTGGASNPRGAEDDLGLADVDMDFGELDFSEDDEAAELEEATSAMPPAYEPAAAAHAPQQVTPEWEPAIEEEPSLEDELGMLLSADGAQPAEPAPVSEPVDDWRYEETPGSVDTEVVPHISLGRANYAPVDENLEPAQGNAEPGDRWDEASDAGWEPETESDPLPETQPDPFAVFSTIAPMATQPQPATVAAPAPQPFEAVDEMETVEIPEAAVPLQDDLDLPEPDMGDEPPAAFDDYDADFAQVFGDVGDDGAATAESETRTAQEADDDLFAEAVGFGLPASGAAGAEYPTPSWHHAGRDYAGAEPGQSDADAIEREIDVAGYGTATAGPADRRRNGMFIAAAVLAIAVVGGLGAFALSFGGGDNEDAPALVQADGEPLKVKPENPGGTTVPNQDRQAYERVAGNAAEAGAAQERLVTTAEEPVDLAARVQSGSDAQENALPGVDEDLAALDGTDAEMAGKSEERIAAPLAEAPGVGAVEDLAAVQPRRVRTMIVRPDGTLVPREDPAPSAPAASALGPIASQSQGSLLQPAQSSETQQPSTGAAATVAEPAARAIREVSTQVQATPVAAEAATTAVAASAASDTMPASGPIVPERPVETQRTQPQTQQQVVQAAAPARTQPAVPQPQAAASEWSMQIASQPTADGAQTTYQDLARRYGGIIGGHGVNIVRADIPGKGTYYRVRIPSNTRAEAISLCEKYKAAGGSCFVSK